MFSLVACHRVMLTVLPRNTTLLEGSEAVGIVPCTPMKLPFWASLFPENVPYPQKNCDSTSSRDTAVLYLQEMSGYILPRYL